MAWPCEFRSQSSDLTTTLARGSKQPGIGVVERADHLLIFRDHRGSKPAGSAFLNSPGVIDKVSDCNGDFLAVRLERKVAGFEEAYIRVRHVPFECFAHPRVGRKDRFFPTLQEMADCIYGNSAETRGYSATLVLWLANRSS